MGAAAFIPVDVAEGAIKSWTKEVADRRAITTRDPIADAFAYCAKDLTERLHQATHAKPSYSTREYAGLHRVRDGTVRKWIEAGELEAHKNAAGDWEIPRTASRKRKKVRA
jgi:hypothetical protein